MTTPTEKPPTEAEYQQAAAESRAYYRDHETKYSWGVEFDLEAKREAWHRQNAMEGHAIQIAAARRIRANLGENHPFARLGLIEKQVAQRQSCFEPCPLYAGDPSEDAAEALADAMGDATHPMHEKHYEAEEEAFTRRYEREQLGAALPAARSRTPAP
jgi:hypothetical protein